MSILYVDLEKGSIESIRDEEEKGTRLALKLLRRYEGEQKLVITSASKDALAVKGACSQVYAFISPVTGREKIVFANSKISLVLEKFGYTAIVLHKRARNLSFLAMLSGSINLKSCPYLRGRSSSYVTSVLGGDLIVVATSCAADRDLLYAGAYEDGFELSNGGLGCRMSRMNLKALAFQNLEIVRTSSEEARRFEKRVASSRFASKLKRDGEASFITKAVRFGYAPIADFSRRFDPRAEFLDGMHLKEVHGAYASTCFDCPISCRKRTKDGFDLPSLEEVMFLGTNLSIFSSESVTILKKKLNNVGLEVRETAAFLARRGVRDVESALLDIDLIMSGEIALEESKEETPRLDYRGCQEGALFYMFRENLYPLFAMYAPVRIHSQKIHALLALYDRAFQNALVERGYSTSASYAAYFSSIPSFFYRIPLLLRLKFCSMKLYGIPALTLLKEGLEIMEVRDRFAPAPVPETLVYKADITFDDVSVQPARLLFYYRHEKARLEFKIEKRA